MLIKNNFEKKVLRENRKHSMDQEQITILTWTLVLGIQKFYFKDAKKCLFLLKGCLNICITENKRINFFPMRVGPVRVTICNERAVAQVEIRKISHASPPPFPPPPPSQKKTLQAPHSHVTDKKTVAMRNLS